MDDVWPCEVNREVHMPEIGQWTDNVTEHGFVITFEASNTSTNELSVTLIVQGGEGSEGYALLVDYELTLSTSSTMLLTHRIERDLWRGERESVYRGVASVDVGLTSLRLRFRLRVIQTLSAQDLRVETPHRNFCVLSGSESFFVDLVSFGDYDGLLTEQLKDAAASGRRRAVVQQLTPTQLFVLLDAVCTYRQLVVTRRNFRDLLSISTELRMTQVLRGVESFLMELRYMDPIRKLELAVLGRCSRLGDAALRQLGSPLQVLDAVHQFLDESDSSLDHLHPDLLQALNIFPDYVIIG